MHYRHFMVDVETTGLSHDRAAMLQIAAVRFNLQTREIDNSSMFCRSLTMPPNRFWDEDTRGWWQSQRAEVFETVVANAQPPEEVLEDFVSWASGDLLDPRDRFFWANNASFDWGFVQSYLRDYGLPNPFAFRNVRDIRTFLEGHHFPNKVPDVAVVKGDMAHNALHDCIYQIAWLFKALDAETIGG